MPRTPGTRAARVWRITDRATFAALRQSRHRARVGMVTITRVDAPPTEPARVAFSIGKHVGRAVQRNLVRRRMRAAIADANPAPGAYLIAAGAPAAGAPASELRRDVVAALARLDGGDRP